MSEKLTPIEWMYTHKPILREYYDYEGDPCEHGEDAVTPSPYHLEGSVWTHTMMVYSHMNAMYDGKGFDYMLLAALLHDIGKMECRGEDEHGNIRFKGHEGYSFFRSVDAVKEYINHRYDGYTDDYTKAVLFAIANHGIFMHNKKMANSPDSIKKAFAPFDKLSLELLHDLMVADKKGRIVAHDVKFNAPEQSPLDVLMDCEYDAPVEVKEPYTKRELVIMVGLPGSGKSTYIKEHLGDYAVISRDAIIMKNCPTAKSYSEAWKSVDQKEIDKELMQHAQKVFKTEDKIVVDMTNLSKKSRKKWLALANQNDFYTKVYVMGTSLATCIDRRWDGNKAIKYDIIETMAKKFTFPLGDEFDFVDIKL
jgi:putative nucleotidyltransferase with HDIG domain